MSQFQFHERIAQLIYTFPEDATTSTGSLFWSAPKRFPQPLTFDPADPTHVAFAQAGAILKAQVHNIEVPAWAADFSKVTITCLYAGLVTPAQALGHGMIELTRGRSLIFTTQCTLPAALISAVLLLEVPVAVHISVLHNSIVTHFLLSGILLPDLCQTCGS